MHAYTLSPAVSSRGPFHLRQPPPRYWRLWCPRLRIWTYCEGCAHTTVETEISHDPPPASQSTRKAGVIQSKSEDLRAWRPASGAGGDTRPSSDREKMYLLLPFYSMLALKGPDNSVPTPVRMTCAQSTGSRLITPRDTQKSACPESSQVMLMLLV